MLKRDIELMKEKAVEVTSVGCIRIKGTLSSISLYNVSFEGQKK